MRWAIFAALLTIDRVTKYLAESYLPEVAAAANIHFFSLSLHHNQGVAFSLLAGFPAASLALSILAVVLFGLLCWQNRRQRLGLAVLFLWAGVIGNLLDRLWYGYVIDWLYIGLYVNLADIWLCTGGAMILCRVSQQLSQIEN